MSQIAKMITLEVSNTIDEVVAAVIGTRQWIERYKPKDPDDEKAIVDAKARLAKVETLLKDEG